MVKIPLLGARLCDPRDCRSGRGKLTPGWFRPVCREIVGVVVARDVWFMMSIGLIVVAAVAALVFLTTLHYPY